MGNPNHHYSARRRRNPGHRRSPKKAVAATTLRDIVSNVTGLFIGGCIAATMLSWSMGPEIERFWLKATTSREELAAIEASVHFSGCNEARAAGAAPIYVGQPGYRSGMDGDGDGVACEPYY